MDEFTINRTDGGGRSIYLQDTPATARTVIFTGAPGMGKTYALDRAARQARDDGDLVIRIDASAREALEHRLVRGVEDQLGRFSRGAGRLLLRQLRRTLDTLISNHQGIQAGLALTARFGTALQLAASSFRDRQIDRPTSTLGQLADRLGELAGRQGRKLLLVIDNLESAHDGDLAVIGELARHLEDSDRPVSLLAGASGQAVDRLLAGGSPDGLAARVMGRYDIRECPPVPAAELRPALVAALHRRGVAVQPDAAARLVTEANGDPGRLTALAEQAARHAREPHGVDRAAAEAAIRGRREADRWAHRAVWSTLDDDARAIVAQACAAPKGIGVQDLPVPADALDWAERGRAIGTLVDAGILRESAGRLTVADPGLRQWVVDHAGPLPAVHSQQSATAARTRRDSAKAPAKSAKTSTATTVTGRKAAGTKATSTTARKAEATRGKETGRTTTSRSSATERNAAAGKTTARKTTARKTTAKTTTRKGTATGAAAKRTGRSTEPAKSVARAMAPIPALAPRDGTRPARQPWSPVQRARAQAAGAGRD